MSTITTKLHKCKLGAGLVQAVKVGVKENIELQETKMY